jgi:hypothetical protein
MLEEATCVGRREPFAHGHSHNSHVYAIYSIHFA